MGKKNLKAQMLYAVKSSFIGNEHQNGGYGSSKHSDLASGSVNGKVYSWSSYHSRVDIACQLSSYLKQNYPEIREVKDLTKEAVESFLLSKAATCTTETLDCYRSNIASLGENLNRTYRSCHLDLRVDKISGTIANQETRCKPMEASHITELKNSFKSGSTGWKAVTLAEAAGLRASEIVRVKSRDIQIVNSRLAVISVYKGKGGRNRDVQIHDAKAVSALIDLKESTPENERLVPVKHESIQKSINRHMKRLEGSEGHSLKEDYKFSGFHSIRKEWAQREFDRCRESGMSRQEALDYTSKQLGHGKDRDLATLQRYISNIW